MIRYLISVLFSAVLVTQANAVQLHGVSVAEQFKLGDTVLQLNGAGVRSKWFFDLYVGSLYLPEKNRSGIEILNRDEIQLMKLSIISDMITSEKMQAATQEGFENSTNGNTEQYKYQIEDFIAFFKDEIKTGDEFIIAYFPGTGIDVFKNKKRLGTIESGTDFKKAVFGIWLSDKPAQESLKQELLGK